MLKTQIWLREMHQNIYSIFPLWIIPLECERKPGFKPHKLLTVISLITCLHLFLQLDFYNLITVTISFSKIPSYPYN